MNQENLTQSQEQLSSKQSTQADKPVSSQSPGPKKLLVWILGVLGIYLLTAGISYAAFRHFGTGQEQKWVSPISSPTTQPEPGFLRGDIDLTAPRTEACPLTGELFTKGEKEIWEKRRPLGIMVENHTDSRPQSGLSKADIVYEAVAEGGITRFLAIYFCRAAAEDVQVGPVRSARTYYLDWISEYGDFPLYAHVGGANNFSGSGDTDVRAQALEQVESFGWRLYNDLDQIAVGFPVYWRDYERLGRQVATEHTVYASTDELWKLAKSRGLTQTDEEGNRWDEDFVSWKFKDDASQADRGNVSKVEFGFWSRYQGYNASWSYNQEQNLYFRSNGNSPQKDLNSNQQLQAKVVVVQFSKQTGPIDVLKHLLYQTTGNGEVIAFQDGRAIKGKWEKDSRQERTLFYDSSGSEIEFNRGQIWIEVLPAGNEVDY